MSEDFIDWLLSHKIVQVILEKVIFFVVSPHGIFIIITAFIAYYGINKKLINVNEWLGFIKEGGYKNKKFWSKCGWKWKNKNKIFFIVVFKQQR